MNGISVDINHLKKGEVNLGTSIMAVKFKDGVILGADSYVLILQIGKLNFINSKQLMVNQLTTIPSVTDKLTQINDKIWCCRSGSAADTQAVADIVKYHLELYTAQHGKPPSAKIAASLLQELTYTNKDALTAGLIVAGYDERSNGEVYSIPLGGSIHKQPFAIAGSGSSYIYGWTDENYKEDFTKEEAVDFVKTALTQAIQWDGSSGGVIRQVILTKDGIERLVFFPDEFTKPIKA
ncbi:putative proteasome subunit beta type-6 [Wickerhamomyces ciferrii]|uniref:proteasome endopeptidase complex n=1 Tax=Wickerhamomyces ciferrii (strain ATCC 14091 / BCRC 22168 / CBS 111 / JCM 3599 / NBRC 0793 / NRRL Y-1031 F-60-10) TaxID=1206466 RepID=K0KJH4_WICCF|nr:putative proteasome subunit beta type-6 [Wickerhamomyces ciferrii]CCH43126.1 putative proteasome subunit beta type-6 [Wickerhamomyces ciferrii]